MSAYVDTSALAKRYIHEKASDAFELFVVAAPHPLCITPLARAEYESLLQRRRRMGNLDAGQLPAVREAFERDLQLGVWQMHPFDPAALSEAVELLEQQGLLSTLDALHLASAKVLGCKAFVSADRQLLRAARSSGLAVHDFSDTSHA
jgi:predicted nucleic acid-binding protein